MKQPTITYLVDKESFTRPITNIHFDQFGNVFSVCFELDHKTYTFFRNDEDRYFNSHGNLEGIINW